MDAGADADTDPAGTGPSVAANTTSIAPNWTVRRSTAITPP
ncbi:hypothetical protein [Kitasatospora sp. NPDC058478]